MTITKDIQIEDLVDQVPESVLFLRKKGIVCVVCGEPVWGTLYEMAKQKGFTDDNIDQLVDELNQLIAKK